MKASAANKEIWQQKGKKYGKLKFTLWILQCTLIKGHKLERSLLIINKASKKAVSSRPHYVCSLVPDKIHIALFVFC